MVGNKTMTRIKFLEEGAYFKHEMNRHCIYRESIKVQKQNKTKQKQNKTKVEEE